MASPVVSAILKVAQDANLERESIQDQMDAWRSVIDHAMQEWHRLRDQREALKATASEAHSTAREVALQERRI